MSTETLCKLYLELANVVPPDCVSVRERRVGAILDIYGSALMAIESGCDDPCRVARDALQSAREQAAEHWPTFREPTT